jgi:membrane-anchored protein YejM (alkaline phosphatase superfamily)
VPDPSPSRRPLRSWLPAFALLSWATICVHLLVFAFDTHAASPGAVAYVVALHAIYSLCLTAAGLAPVAAVVAATAAWRRIRRAGPASPERAGTLVLGLVGVAGTASVHVVITADAFVRERWGFHLNGMIWDLVTTPGGIESLGAGGSTRLSVAVMVAGFVALQAVALVAAVRSSRLSSALQRVVPARLPVMSWATAALVGTTLFASGLCEAASYRPVTTAADAYPLRPRFKLQALAEWLGFRPIRDADDAIRGCDGSAARAELAYPLNAIRRRPDAPTPNVVLLVCESLRADMLTPEIMPNTCAFADGGRRFDRHFSAGNGTQMGVFGLFYGLYGTYWDPFVAAARGPVLLDVLHDAAYDLEAFTSARFSYPPFDRTVFARVPRDRLHERDPELSGWKNDRANVAKLLASIDRVPRGTPFFRFEFFESPHAPYLFPEKDVLRTDYARDLNYMSMDPSDPAEIRQIFHRYENACHHLDQQLGRVFDGLRERGLLESTIVLVAGDHGEEFMEHGHWGHHSAVTDAQTRTVFVLRGPGVPAGVETGMTSHLDLAPTLLRLVGAENPPSDFSLGRDLVEGPRREQTVVSGFDDVAVIDDRWKVVHAFHGAGSLRERATTADDRPVEDDPAVAARRAAQTRELLDDARRFVR